MTENLTVFHDREHPCTLYLVYDSGDGGVFEVAPDSLKLSELDYVPADAVEIAELDEPGGGAVTRKPSQTQKPAVERPRKPRRDLPQTGDPYPRV